MTLAPQFDERLLRMAVGVDVRDALRGEAAPRVTVRVERPLDVERVRAARRRRAGWWSELLAEPRRHPSGRIALLYSEVTDDHVDLRILDALRRFVPRRVRLPITPAGSADDARPRQRTRFVSLYPGAAYPHSGNATGMRGRALRGGEPLRWGRVEARRGSTVVGRAHVDDRGEFLLLLSSDAVPGSELPSAGELTLDVHVFARPSAPTPDPPDLPALDPLFDLPLETVSGTPPEDAVSAGRAVPPALSATGSTPVTFRIGTVLVGTAPVVLP